MALGVIAKVLLAQLTPTSSYGTAVLPGLLITGAGMGCIFAPAFSAATLGVAPNEAGIASAMVNTAQQIGGSIGTSLLSTIYASAVVGYPTSHLHTRGLAGAAQVQGDTTAFWWAAGVFGLGFLLALLILPSGCETRPTTTMAALARHAIGNCHYDESAGGAATDAPGCRAGFGALALLRVWSVPGVCASQRIRILREGRVAAGENCRDRRERSYSTRKTLLNKPVHKEGAHATATAPGFANNIKPLFRESDRTAMLRAFDLWSYDDVTSNSGRILAALRKLDRCLATGAGRTSTSICSDAGSTAAAQREAQPHKKPMTCSADWRHGLLPAPQTNNHQHPVRTAHQAGGDLDAQQSSPRIRRGGSEASLQTAWRRVRSISTGRS